MTPPSDRVLVKLSTIAVLVRALLGRNIGGLLVGWSGHAAKDGRLVHVQTYLNEHAGALDRLALEKLVNSPDVKAWLREAEKAGLAPTRPVTTADLPPDMD